MSALERILVAKGEDIAALKAAAGPVDVTDAPPLRGFTDALLAERRAGRRGIIAEFKRISPSTGAIATDAMPEQVCTIYRDAGAVCLSVLTEKSAFGGDMEDLTRARSASGLPCLCKDFMLDPVQIDEARRAGADAVLLILSILDDAGAERMCARAAELGMDVLVEVHTADDLARACRLPVRLIGINNRDLATLAIDLSVTERLAADVPDGRLVVAESGIASPEDVVRLSRAGADAFLIGSHLMGSGDVAQALAPLVVAAGWK